MHLYQPCAHHLRESGPSCGDARVHPGRRNGDTALADHQAISSRLLAVYDRPMIHYPLSTAMAAGVPDVLVIITSDDQPALECCWGRD